MSRPGPMVSVTSTAFALAIYAGAVTPSAAQRGGSVLPGSNSRAPISVNAERLDYFDKEQKLVYSGAVTAKQGESTLRSSALTIFMNGSAVQGGESGGAAASGGGPGGGQVKRMEAAGPVTITSKDQVGQGDRGIYDKGENKVYLIGNVSLTQGPNVVKGKPEARLVYDLTTGRAQIIGGVTSLFTPGSSNTWPGKPAPKPKP